MPISFENGPYLEAALLCERILGEVDGVKSVIRIVDRVTRRAVGTAPPAEMESFEYALSLYIRFKSGAARGSMTLQIKMVKPSGESPAPLTNTVVFEGEDDRGVDIEAELKLKLDQTGLYWFFIILNGVTLTRVPFRVVYIPQVMQKRG